MKNYIVQYENIYILFFCSVPPPLPFWRNHFDSLRLQKSPTECTFHHNRPYCILLVINRFPVGGNRSTYGRVHPAIKTNLTLYPK